MLRSFEFRTISAIMLLAIAAASPASAAIVTSGPGLSPSQLPSETKPGETALNNQEAALKARQAALKNQEATLREQLAERPDDPALLHGLGTVLSLQDRIDEARPYWDKAASLDPNFSAGDLLVRVGKVFRLLEQGKPKEAQAELDALEKKHSENPHFHFVRGELAVKGGNFSAAEAAYEKAYKLAPKLSATSLSLARFYELQNRNELARKYYLEATKVAPDRPQGWRALGGHQFKQGRLGDALESFRRAEKANPQEPPAEVQIAQLHVGLGDLLGARRWYLAALDRKPKNQDAIRRSLSDVQIRLGLLDEAKQQIQTALANKEDVALVTTLAMVEQQQGDLKQAETHYRRVLKLKPDHVLATNNLAMLLLQLDRPADEVLQLAEAARQEAPADVTVLGTHACALYHAGKRDEARKALANAVRLSPSDPWIRYCYGKLLWQDGNREEGRQHLQGCLILDGEFPRKAEIEALLGKSNN